MSLKHHPDCQEHITGKCTCPVNRTLDDSEEFPPIIGWDDEKREEEAFWSRKEEAESEVTDEY